MQEVENKDTQVQEKEHLDIQKEKIRAMVNNIYSMQKMRIQCGNRLVASFMGLGEISRNRTPESVKAKTENTYQDDTDRKIDEILGEYKRITDTIAQTAKGENIHGPTKSAIKKAIDAINNSESKLEFIHEVFDYNMADIYQQQLNIEERATATLVDEVKKHPLWDAFFADVRGCGPMMAAVCIAYFDVYKARHPSAFWKYAGLDVVINEDGTTEGRGKKHTEVQDYVDKDGNIKQKNGITYNPVLKSKLVFVLGSSFIKSAKKDGTLVGYGKIYYDYKNRLENKPTTKDFSPLHKHRMAIRYAVKQFVRDLWIAWRKLEGLEVGEPYYEVAKLGMKPHGYNGI